MKKTVLIAGAGGFLGSKMTETFLKKKYKVIALDRFFFGDVLSDLKKNKNLTIVKDDIRYVDKKIFKKVDTLINLASISNDPAADLNPDITRKINFLGAKNMAILAKKMGVKKYVLASSCSVYGSSNGKLYEDSPLSPISEYAKSKTGAEKAVLSQASKKFSPIVFRLATIYGVSVRRMRFDLMLNLMCLTAWKNNKIIIMGGGKQWRPLIHINDVIKAFEKIINLKDTSKLSGEIFNIGSNEQNYQVFQVANEFKRFFSSLDIVTAPDDPDPRNYKVNFDKARKVLGFKPSKTIKEGIAELKSALEKGQVTDDIKTSTLKYYQYLTEAEKTLNFVKLRKKLF